MIPRTEPTLRTDPLAWAEASVAEAGRRFVAALLDADPQALEILADDPASGLGRFGIGAALACRLIAEHRAMAGIGMVGAAGPEDPDS